MRFWFYWKPCHPSSRVVFLLRQVFDYEYAEIAEIVGKEETTCRQLFSRAKKHIAAHRPRFHPRANSIVTSLEEFMPRPSAQANSMG